MKRIALLIPMFILLLASCNLRENLLLPPELSAADYLSGNKIESYANYLVRSANDDSYLFIPKESITDSLLNYNDEIIFHKVQSFASRDSLGFQSSASALSDTYQFSIQRSGSTIDLYPLIPLATIYTHLEASSDPYYFVNYSYYLQAAALDPDFYGSTRAAIPVLSTGEFAIYSFGNSANPSLEHNGTSIFHALLLSDTGHQLTVNYPAAYCAAAGDITLSMTNNLSLFEQTQLQQLYPNAALNSPFIIVRSSSSPGDEVAVLRLQQASKGFFGKQWIYLSKSDAYSWPASNADSGTANWWQDSTGLYSFIKDSGSYFLATPLDSQNEVNIPLNGSISQVFLQELWFDLNGLTLDGISMKVKLNPDYSPYQASYFGGEPFTIEGNHQLFDISFSQGGVPLISLPDDNWLEFGFRTSLPASANDRLFYLYRDASQDFITYKTAGTAYDATHYYRNGNYVYSGISLSGAYLYAAASDEALQKIPYLKPVLYLQSSRSVVSWKGPAQKGYSHILLQHQPEVPDHPWLQGEPLTLNAPQALANISSYSGTTPQSTLPEGFLLSLPISWAPQNLLLFADDSHPRLRNYQKAASHTASSYVTVNERLEIYPAYPGTLIAANIEEQSHLQLQVFPTMSFFWKDIIINTYGHAAQGQSTVLSIEILPSLADPYGILASQYDLSQNSMAYHLTAAASSDYAAFEPMLYFKRISRSQELLFYETEEPYYRLYPYSQSTDFDPWHFIIDNGFSGISLAYDGSYASYTESNSHSSSSASIAAPPQDTVLSLYQAQLVIPSFFAGPTLPLGSRASLAKLSSLPGFANLLAAYRLGFSNPSGTAFLPNFYQVPAAPQVPYIYIPVEDISSIPVARMFFIDYLGQVSELSRVDSFSNNYAQEFRVVGNSFICTVPNPGIFLVSSDN